jgi:hypothetical protein
MPFIGAEISHLSLALSLSLSLSVTENWNKQKKVIISRNVYYVEEMTT